MLKKTIIILAGLICAIIVNQACVYHLIMNNNIQTKTTKETKNLNSESGFYNRNNTVAARLETGDVKSKNANIYMVENEGKELISDLINDSVEEIKNNESTFVWLVLSFLTLVLITFDKRGLVGRHFN